MMRRVLLLNLALAAACGGEDDSSLPLNVAPVTPGDERFERNPALDVPNISRHGERRSHNAGQNCIGCHQALGPGRGRFQVALTVFDASGQPVVDPTLELRTESPFAGGGELVARIEGDALGNVFTTEELPFLTQSLFPVVIGKLGTSTTARSAAMPFPTQSGACNLCHRGLAGAVKL
jgi:hypothetical protein